MPMDLAYNVKAVDRVTGQEYATIHVPARSAEAIVYITVSINTFDTIHTSFRYTMMIIIHDSHEDPEHPFDSPRR